MAYFTHTHQNKLHRIVSRPPAGVSLFNKGKLKEHTYRLFAKRHIIPSQQCRWWTNSWGYGYLQGWWNADDKFIKNISWRWRCSHNQTHRSKLRLTTWKQLPPLPGQTIYHHWSVPTRSCFHATVKESATPIGIYTTGNMLNIKKAGGRLAEHS